MSKKHWALLVGCLAAAVGLIFAWRDPVWANIIERTMLHFALGAFAEATAFEVFDLCRRKKWLPTLHGLWAFALPILVVIPMIIAREIWDSHAATLYAGQEGIQPVWWKSYIDVPVWFIAASFWAWIRYKRHERVYEVGQELLAWKRGRKK